MIEINFNGSFEFDTKYAALNRDRLNYAETCDREIVLGDRSYPCHKEVLSNAFAYFETRFNNEQTIILNPALIRTLKNEPFTSANVLVKLLNIAYTGILSFCKSEAYDVFHDCLIFDFKYANDLWKIIYSKNCCSLRVLDFFDLLHRRRYKSDSWFDVIKYVAKQFNDLSQSEEFLGASAWKMRHLMCHLPEYVNEKEHLLDFIIRWGQRNYEERRHTIPHLLKNIYVRHISGAFVKDVTAKLLKVEHLYESELQKKFIADTETKTLRTFVHMKNADHYYFFEYALAKNGEWHYATAEIVDRNPISKFVLVEDRLYNLRPTDHSKDQSNYSYSFRCAPITNYNGLLKICDDSGSSDNLDTLTKKTPRLRNPINNFQMTAIDAKIYLYFSTRVDTNSHEHLLSYNCETDEWSTILSDPYLTLTNKSVLISHNNFLYVLGGQRIPFKTHLRKGYAIFYDERCNRWNRLPDMKHAHSCGAACSFDGKIYVAGGKNFAGETINAVEMFDPVAGKWNSVSSLHVKRQLFTLTPFNNSLWAIGNQCSLGMEIYDPKTESWSIYEKSLVRAQGDRTLLNLWKPQYRYADGDDMVAASVSDAIAF